jgi:chitodextrinase
VKVQSVLVGLLVIVLVTSLVPGCIEESENKPPMAIFQTLVTTVNVGDVVGFDATNSSDDDGSIASYHWSFGDGTESYGMTASHAFTEYGEFNVTLTVTDDKGKKSLFVQTIVVNAFPEAYIDVDRYQQFLGDPFVFSAERSVDPDGVIASYLWDFGDGDISTSRYADHAFSRVGQYDVTLTVRDDHGAETTAKERVEVIYHTFNVNFTKRSGDLPTERNYTLEYAVTVTNLTLNLDNLHLVRFRLSWRDLQKPIGGDPNDMFRLTVSPPVGDKMDINGTSENLTLLFPLTHIPVNRTMEGANGTSVLEEVRETLGSTLGNGTWVVHVEAEECGGFWEDELLVKDLGNLWDLAVHYEYYDIEIAPAD